MLYTLVLTLPFPGKTIIKIFINVYYSPEKCEDVVFVPYNFNIIAL